MLCVNLQPCAPFRRRNIRATTEEIIERAREDLAFRYRQQDKLRRTIQQSRKTLIETKQLLRRLDQALSAYRRSG